MFDWVGDLIVGVGDTITGMILSLTESVATVIWDVMIGWIYTTIFGAIADFLSIMSGMGAEIFELEWVRAAVTLFTLFGWSLFIAGSVVAVFDFAIECQSGRTSIKSMAMNILKGFFACSLFGVVPVELYKFCTTLQNVFAHDLAEIFGRTSVSIVDECSKALYAHFSATTGVPNLLSILSLSAFAYCVLKVFFANIKRGGILLIQMSVGAMYMFSVPRGYSDGFNQWCRQVAALCLTTFMQTTLLFLGLMTFTTDMLPGLGIMLAANEVPRIAQQFGLDSSVKVSMMNIVHSTTTAVNLTRSVIKAVGK